MENRFSRASSQRSATTSDLDDALYPVYHHYRPGPSLAISTSGRRPAPSPSRDYTPARPSSPEDVFADPADSPPPSPSGSAFYSSSIVTPTPSVRRPSLSLSARRSPSPLPGGPAGYYQHHRMSQSLTPSVRSSSSSTYGHGNGLNRSNTTGTTATGYSTLSSIPSNLSDLTSPPSPLPAIAPVRPQWNYGGHQQNIYPESVNTGSVVPEEMDDPFADDFMIPVGDGFAPHHERPPPAVVFPSGASSVGSIEPPPYTRYPDQPKPEVIGAPLRMQVSNGDSGIDVGRDEEEDRRNSRRGVLAAGGAVGLLAAEATRGGDGGEPRDDGSGAHKEWNDKRWLGFRMRTVIVGIAVAVLLLLSIGLGVGLGVGLHQNQSPTATATVYPTATSDVPPTSEETGPPLSSPNGTFPTIPTGIALINPLALTEQSSSCYIAPQDASAPDWFNMGGDLLWSCGTNQDDTKAAYSWRFDRGPIQLTNMEEFNSEPDFLRGAEFEHADWGGYMVSSAEGIRKWELGNDLIAMNEDGEWEEFSGQSVWRDGTQNQAFWRIPFAFYNTTDGASKVKVKSKNKGLTPRSGSKHESGLNAMSTTTKRSSDHSFDDNYKFAIFFNKTIIIKQTTIDGNIARKGTSMKTGNGTALIPGEIVWKCVWEKSLLEIEVMVDVASTAVTQEKGVGSGHEEETDDSDDEDDLHPGPTHTHGDGPRPTGCPPHDCPYPGGPFPTDGPPPPPPGRHHDEDDDDNFFGLKPPQPTPSTNGNLTYRPKPKEKDQKRNIYERTAPTPFPLKVFVKESRPSTTRIRQLLGIDLTDPDPKGRANLGAVKCVKYVVTNKGGLVPLVDNMSGEGYVVLKEQGGGKGRLRERGDSDCYCKWNS